MDFDEKNEPPQPGAVNLDLAQSVLNGAAGIIEEFYFISKENAGIISQQA